MTVLLILAIAVFLCAIASAMGKCPDWVPIVLIALYLLIEQLPLGKS